MLLLVGYVIVLLASIGTYSLHGSLGALWVPLEYVAIFGMTVGYLVASNGTRSLKAVLGAIPSVLKGSPYNKALYMDLLALLFELLAKVRKEGLMSIESDVENPAASPIFSKYPSVMKDHHAVEFITDYLRMMVSGNLNAHEIESLMDSEIETHHQEAHKPAAAFQRLAGALPAFGIVAAVLGVIKTMGSVGQPPAVLGGMIGAALVGTFLGIFLSYAIVDPLAGLLEQKNDEDSKELQCIKTTLLASMQGYAPQVAVEFGRKVLYSTERPSFGELEEHVKGAKAR